MTKLKVCYKGNATCCLHDVHNGSSWEDLTSRTFKVNCYCIEPRGLCTAGSATQPNCLREHVKSKLVLKVHLHEIFIICF
jgi:hypothetical protein